MSRYRLAEADCSAGRITVSELADDYRESRKGQVSVRAWERHGYGSHRRTF